MTSPHTSPAMRTCLLFTLHSPVCPRSYEAYLSSFVTEADLKYLQDADTARRVVELG